MTYVYLLESISLPGRWYVGHTDDLRSRLAAHNAGQSSHTAKYKPWRLVAYVAFSDEAKAIAFERYLKTASGRAFAKKRLCRTPALTGRARRGQNRCNTNEHGISDD